MKNGRVQKMIALAKLHDEGVYRRGRKEGIEIGEQKMKKLAIKMRDRGEPEEKVFDDTGYTFKDLDSSK